MNNIHAEVDEIFRTGNKKAVVSLFLSMQGNHIRAVEAETRLTKAQAGIERKDELIEQMREALQKIFAIKRTVDLNLFDIEAIHSIAEAALRAADGGK